VVLIRRGREDLPGVRYHVVRAARRDQCIPVEHEQANRNRKRSKYGVKRPKVDVDVTPTRRSKAKNPDRSSGQAGGGSPTRS
jgi:hypothetical protein